MLNYIASHTHYHHHHHRRTATTTTIMSIWFLLVVAIIASVAITGTRVVVFDSNDELFSPSTSLRGTPLGEDIIKLDHGMDEALRRLVRSSSSSLNYNNYNRTDGHDEEDAHNKDYSHHNNGRDNKAPSSSTWNNWHTQWSTLSEADLGAIAYDVSLLEKEAHHAWGAAYVAGRRTNGLPSTAAAALVEVEEEGGGEDGVVDSLRERLTDFFLRGNSILSPPPDTDDADDDDDSDDSMEDEQQQNRNLEQSTWTTHGSPNNNDPMGGLSYFNMEQNTASITFDSATNNEEEGQTTTEEEQAGEQQDDLWERLERVKAKTQQMNERHVKYDTNDGYNYSNPSGTTPQGNSNNNNESSNNNNNNASSESDNSEFGANMQQFSHTSQDQRQRLLTGSYAAWQWYDRERLSSPTNLNLRKVSRINYAFFQSDAEGYVFGTDSWADPNVLFGEYEFTVGGSDRLPSECRGGRGRDDGRDGGDLKLDDDDESEEGEGGGGSVAGDASSSFAERRRRVQTTLTTDSSSTNTNSNTNINGGNKGNTKTKCEYFEQCHRNFPNSKSCNIHKYKQGLIYRAHVSGAQVYPSIGGWTLSGSFPTVAADAEKRRRFAKECVGLIEDYGFDGIDIDWEYPGYTPHGGSPKDRQNFNLLLLEIKEHLVEYQDRTGDAPLGGGSFGLTAALPCGPSNIDFLDVPFLSEVLDGMNLMTFDFHNEMESKTGVNSPLYDQTWDEESGLSVDGCVKNYYEGGAGNVAQKISIGVPFYGKTFSYATELGGDHSNTNGRGGGGMVDQKNWPQDLGTPVYYNILDKLSKGNMVSKRHEPTMTQYAYFKDGSGLVTYDDPQAVCNKAEYVNNNLLGGLFVWEMSGDLMMDLQTPLLDAINRKLEETNFDCRIIASPEDGTVITLPDPAPKGPAQVIRREDESAVTAIIDHMDKAEDGELTSGGGGSGAFTRTAFMYRTWDGRLFPSYEYRYPHFLDALRTMSTVGVDGSLFYLGHGQEDSALDAIRHKKERRRRRELQFEEEEEELGPTEVSETSLVYGLVNIAAYLAQAMTDSIIHDACDELNIDHLPNDDMDGKGLDDGKDMHRFPISNACGQNGRSYEDEICDAVDRQYDCVSQMNVEELASMEAHGISRGHWPGAPGPFYCGPKDVYGTTGFWDAMVGREKDDVPTENDSGRTDVSSCCWWGRGSLSIKGTCLYGKLNYHIGKNKADREGPENALFPDIDFCRDPGKICAGSDSIQLRWISGMYHWMENVQKYDRGGFRYMDELVRFVNDDLVTDEFFNRTTNIHVLGCHDAKCTQRTVDDFDDRLRAFEKVMTIFGLQFGSHAEPEPPFQVFPGQQAPTPSPTIEGYAPEGTEDLALTSSPSQAPVEALVTEIVPVNVFLTGVPEGINMTNEELSVFEGLMYDLLVPRLATVNVNVLEVVTDRQDPETDFVADSAFASQSGESIMDGEVKPVLQVVMNVTMSYNPPAPDGVRDWSIYIKSWIESFGNTMVEIFTTPKHERHPQTNSKFWDNLVDVSATNVHPPNTEPTMSPSPPPPPIIIYPDNSKNTYIYAGVGAAVGLLICCFCCLFCYKLRQYRQLTSGGGKKEYDHWGDDEEYNKPQDKGFSHPAVGKNLTKVTEENSYDSESSEDEDSSSSEESSSDDDSDNSSSEEEDDSDEESDAEETKEEEEESMYSYDETATKSRSYYSEASSALESAPDKSRSYYSEDSSAMESAPDKSRSYYSEASSAMESAPESKSQSYYSEASSAMESYEDTATQSKSAYSGMSQSMYSESESSNALHAHLGDGSEGGGAQAAAIARNDELEREMKKFDDIVDRVLANDPALKQVVLDDRKQINGHRHTSDELWNALVGNTYVERLSLRSCNITDEEAASLSLALVDNRCITHIWLGDNDITSEGVEYLIATLESNQTIVYLELAGNPDIDPSLEDEVRAILGPREDMYKSEPEIDEVAQLMERVRSNDPTLTKLDLSSMNIGPREDAVSLFDALAGNTHIKHVDLSLNDLDDDCISSISLALIENTGVTHLNLANNSIYSEGAEYLIGTLDTNKTLQEIDLSGNMIDQSILEEIDVVLEQRQGGTSARGQMSGKSSPVATTVQRLAANDPDLIEVNLNGINLAESPDAEAIFDATASNKWVTRLSFDNTEMDDTMVAALSLALVDNTHVTHISLRDNQITSEGCEYLLGTLDSNMTISHIDLSGNSIDKHLINEVDAIVSQRQAPEVEHASNENEMSLSLLLQRVKSNDPTLTEILLDNRELAVSNEVEDLFDALAGNSIVRKLSLCNNGIDDSLAAALSLALVDNTTISEVILSDNHITSEGCEYLLGTLDSNTTVSYIDMSGNPIGDMHMREIDAINSSRSNGRANQAPPAKTTKATKSNIDNAAPDLDLSKPPMHEVPEESDTELAKRKAIQSIMRDSSIPWAEKNQRIMELQKQFYVPKDGSEQPPQAANTAVENDTGSVHTLIDRVIDDDRTLVKIDINGQELGREDETSLFDALATNTHVTSLSLVNCRIANDGAAELVNALKQNSTLTTINLEDNQITSNAALDFISVLKEDNDTVEHLELKDNRVRSGLLSQLNKLLERRREGIPEPEPATVMAASVATTSFAQVAPVTARVSTDVQSTASSRKSGSRSTGGVSKASDETPKARGSKKHKSKSRGDRPRRNRKERKTPTDFCDV